MEHVTEGLRKFLTELRSLTLWARIFRWSKVKELSIAAMADLQAVVQENKSMENSLAELRMVRAEKENLLKEKAATESKCDNYFKRGIELSNEVSLCRQKLEAMETQLKSVVEENTRFKTQEDQRRRNFEHSVANLNDTINRLKNERETEKQAAHEEEIARLVRMKETWSNHEEIVRNRIRAICQKHGVEFVNTVPFKGKPDVTLRINSEYVIFDAKSPAGDDLSNFPLYLKGQSENLAKYVREQDVRREIFLVVPANTLEHLDMFEYRLVDYTVYIVSVDSLEPIILALRRIEDYEFAQQMSPEERENICRVIGKFVHLSKRRIQIDGFFANQFFEILYRSEADLPVDIQQAVDEFERAEKLNPPLEKRARQISIKELEADAARIKSDAAQKGIYTDESFLMKNINKLPLYTRDPQKPSSGEKDLFSDQESGRQAG